MMSKWLSSYLLATLTACAIAFCGASSGCDRRTASAGAGGRTEPLRVLATTYPMADIARVVGGDRVKTMWWVESGQSLAELRDSPERREQLHNADLIITRGQVDPWTLLGAGNTYQHQRILRMDTLPAGRDQDPAQYIWLDPMLSRDLAEEVCQRLSTLDPAAHEQFRANADRFIAELEAMRTQTKTMIDRAGGGPFVTLDRGFNVLALRYGLEEVKVPSVDLRAPTAFNIRQLREAVEAHGGGAVFASTEMPPALLRDWEGRLGLPVLPLDPLGTSAASGRSTYLEITRYNLGQLEKGVALAKPRDPSAPKPLGAVTYEPPRFSPPPEPATAPAQAQEEDQAPWGLTRTPLPLPGPGAAAPRLSPQRPATSPGPQLFPQAPSVERFRFDLPTPMPTTSPVYNSPVYNKPAPP